MNSGPVVFLALLVAMAGSWLGFIMGPALQVGDTSPTKNILIGKSPETYPVPQQGTAHQGAEVYRANGCFACHTQQVRPQSMGPDINRGWGLRRSTAYDYLYQYPVMLGTQRVGPDLANAGLRMDKVAVLLHLYEPRAITAHSIMPSYHYLFEEQRIAGAPSPDALLLPAEYAPPTGYEIIPKPEALQLANYITSLRQDGYLYEAPPPPQALAKTNSPAATNSPTK